jgi:5'-nucleotidase
MLQSGGMKHKSILVDLDMVITDFHGGFQEVWEREYPDRKVIPLQNRMSFYLTKDYDQIFEADIERIINAENFLLKLKSLPGAVEGFNMLLERYVSVRVCTTSLKNSFSSGEKWQWVCNHLGKRCAEEMIVCNDKTLIKADYLIDDRPLITGEAAPEWKHVIFHQPYNYGIEGLRYKWGDVFDFT